MLGPTSGQLVLSAKKIKIKKFIEKSKRTERYLVLGNSFVSLDLGWHMHRNTAWRMATFVLGNTTPKNAQSCQLQGCHELETALCDNYFNGRNNIRKKTQGRALKGPCTPKIKVSNIFLTVNL